MQGTSPNLDVLFRAKAASQPRHAAILGPGLEAVTTYGELDQAIEAAARELIRAGIGPRDCVGLHCPSGANYIVLTYAIWRIGGCVVPLPVELHDLERQQILRSIGIDAVITTDRGAAFLTPFGSGEQVEVKSGHWLGRIRPSREHPAGFGEINAAFIRFTSGTTGKAKGVVLSHETIEERFNAANTLLNLSRDDRVLWLLSMSYHFAVSIAAYLSYGAGIILPSHHLGTEILAAACVHGATVLYGSPTHVAWLAKAPNVGNMNDLRLAVSTTAPLTREVGLDFMRRFGLPVTQALGLIEIGLPFINIDFAAERCEAIGRPVPAYKVKLADIGYGEALREVLLSGPGCLDAYYDPWRPRSEILRDGWFHTGDVGELDEQGCLVLRGRVKDVINVAGMKFFPYEVEEVLTSHPDVVDACVLREADSHCGEMPYAQVVLRHQPSPMTDENYLLDYCQRRLASYKVPSRIEFVASLPRTASGKVLHRYLDAPEVRFGGDYPC